MNETAKRHPKIVDEFLHYLLDERHFSPYTARCYGVDLRQYAEYITEELNIHATPEQEAEALRRRLEGRLGSGPDGEHIVATLGASTLTAFMLDADVNAIRKFLEHLSHQNYSPATMARKIATLRSFHRWLEKRGLITNNPMLMIRTPKQAKRLPKAIDVEQVEKLLAAPNDNTLLGARARAILETLYSTGIRVSELVGINRGDVHDPGHPRISIVNRTTERRAPRGPHTARSGADPAGRSHDATSHGNWRLHGFLRLAAARDEREHHVPWPRERADAQLAPHARWLPRPCIVGGGERDRCGAPDGADAPERRRAAGLRPEPSA